MKKKKIVYENVGKNKGFIKVSIIPKKERHKGVDGILVEWASDDDYKKGYENFVAMKDWEALIVIKGLIQALIEKRKGENVS